MRLLDKKVQGRACWGRFGVAGLDPERLCVRPGVDEVEEGEELQYDPTAYDCMHVMSLDWPCLRCAAQLHRQSRALP